jgi:hypothetical protein
MKYFISFVVVVIAVLLPVDKTEELTTGEATEQ